MSFAVATVEPPAPVPECSMRWFNVDLRWAYNDLLKSILFQTRCAQRAYDVLHDALVRLAIASGRTTIQEPHAYLRSVVASVLVDHQRDGQRWVPLPEETTGGAAAAEGVPPRLWLDNDQPLAPSAEYLADLNQRLQAVQRILDCLPPRCREVFWLFRIEGHTQAAIAARLGIHLKTVEYHLTRALLDLHAVGETLA